MTTLSTSLRIATSSLGATQVQLSVTSNNIANADTDGYTAKTANQSAKSSAGVGSGVSVNEIVSQVSQYLLTDLLSATSDAASTTLTDSYLNDLQSALGSLSSETGEGTSLANAIADLEDALTSLATTPESASLASAAVAALQDVTYQINETAASVDDQIANADSEIQASVEDANEAIETIQSLNEQIRVLAASGQSTADLEDQLTVALVNLSAQMDIKTFSSSDGTLKVYTTSGQVLVDSQAHLLETSLDADGETLISVNGSDITDRIKSGTLGSLIELRDETLPAYGEALDELATGLMTALNTVQPGLLTGTGAGDLAVANSFLDDPTTLLGAGNGATMATALLDALQGDTTFAAAGGLPAGDRSFADYASEIVSKAVNESNSASSALDLAESELSLVEDTIASTYGVNVDEETERLAELEQLYALASTILSTIQDMFDDLRSAVS